MLQQFPRTEEEWRTHVLNIHGTPFEQICEYHLRHAPDWTFRSSRYPVEFPPSYSPQVSQTKNSELDLWGNCFSPGLKTELLVECKKNNPEYTDWVFFPTINPAPTFPSIRGVKYGPSQRDQIHPWVANSHILSLVPPINVPITGDGREIKGDYQSRLEKNQNNGKQLVTGDGREIKGDYQSKSQQNQNGKQLTKTSNAAITEAAYQIALATQALLHQERLNQEALAAGKSHPMPPYSNVFLPLIVTTANLWTCHFPEEKVDLVTGVVPVSEAQYQQHSCLFYTYALPPILQLHPGEHQWIYRTDAQWEELARFSILVVQSAAFPELLTCLSKMTKDADGRLVLPTLKA